MEVKEECDGRTGSVVNFVSPACRCKVLVDLGRWCLPSSNPAIMRRQQSPSNQGQPAKSDSVEEKPRHSG